ncbi:MAG: Nif11-like leader peptide family natural product precursor [Atopobiaceae bacterium]|nr:Nif11-like leader peptide family natural product precursor [Atopobiaceae bacterium]
MSTKDARRFINDLDTDEKLIAHLGNLGPAKDDEAAGAYYARFAKELGYDFTEEEYDAGLMQVRAARKGVIMEQELDELEA